ncbi:DNA polymerase III subunit delta' [Curvivirga aplysinae]|uniref:DNA polymerase III subunit delta' n=1 Tax=Curvivirga aplysinae TaxID=2529852 RepID=UPI0012BC2CDE|nr:DNA polymerase III subunit delta' [Curvivirga aplysinae]MTI10048.1 DNA polymerase III subunit delta' [Curvivirga aplysinae]
MMFDEPEIADETNVALLSPRDSLSVKGHEANEQLLLDAWNSGKLHHAWLFTGPKGIGKASLGYQFARFILAGGGEGGGLFGDQPDSLKISAEHPVYRRMMSGGHSDFQILEKGMMNPDTKRVAENDIPVAIARKAIEFIRLTPAESDWRVILVDAADDLNRNAANALLKVLEEPPARAIFILISHAPGRLLPTIKSRCRKLTFKSIPDESVSELLVSQYPELGNEDAHALARLSEGSIGKAMELQDNGGLDLFRMVVSLLSHPQDLSLTKLHSLADTLSRKDAKENYIVFRNLIDWWFKRLLKILAGDHMPKPIFAEEYMAIEACKALMPLGKWLEAADLVNERLWQTEAPSNLDRRQVVIDAFLTLETLAQGR